uniref:Uncharacterized protein n=1 Tax=Vitis vinifera TaxID=29760 RepID=A5AJ36_VITVI|nr:hypothetical protein VITISV_005123 [Vitis vinifera]
MGRCVGDGKVVDGGAILGTVISDMVASRRGDIGDGRMTSAIMVACGVVVSSREGRGDGRLVDSGVVSGIVTSGIVASVVGNTGDGRVVSDTTCPKREGLGEGDGRGEGGSVETLSANGVDDVDGANMVSGGCIDHRGCQPARPSSRLLPLPWPRIGCILTVVADTSGLMDGYDDVGDRQSECMRCSSPITCKISIAIR